MSYVQYTRCVDANNHVDMNRFLQAALLATIPGGISGVLVLAVGDPGCGWIAAEIYVLAGIVAYCHWFLEDRLICLPTGEGQDRTAVGMVVSVETAAEKPFPESFDTDLSINLLLLNTPPGYDQAQAQEVSPYGELIREQDAIASHSLEFTGVPPALDRGTGIRSAVLHAEFEGAGIIDLLLASQIALGVAAAALIICLTIGGWIAPVLAILALLALLVGAIIARGDTAGPGDAGLPSIETNKTDGKGAHILGVMGHWVYDSGHNGWPDYQGWNEIHPIKMAQKLGTWDGDWPKGIDEIVADWENMVWDTVSPGTIESQKLPENQWQIHPFIDGCTPAATPVE